MDSLSRLTRLTRERDLAVAEWHAAIRAAREAGFSNRAIADVAGVSHVRVQQIIKGDPAYDPAYVRAHLAVNKARGKPKECSVCETTDPERVYDWANLTGHYDDITDYGRMCRKCHRAYDRERKAQIVRGQ